MWNNKTNPGLERSCGFQKVGHGLYCTVLCFKFGFKGLNRVRLSDISREVIPEKRGMIGKAGPAAS